MEEKTIKNALEALKWLGYNTGYTIPLRRELDIILQKTIFYVEVIRTEAGEVEKSHFRKSLNMGYECRFEIHGSVYIVSVDEEGYSVYGSKFEKIKEMRNEGGLK